MTNDQPTDDQQPDNQPSDNQASDSDSQQSRFEALARFLMDPFLDKPEALKFHTENLAGGKKLWLRAAFDENEDKGRVFGRGGRNINAMRTVISAAAKPVNMNVSLSVFGEPVPERSERSDRSSGGRSSGGGRGRGGDRGRERPARASTNPAPPKKKPKAE